jgi:hypothetical protein
VPQSPELEARCSELISRGRTLLGRIRYYQGAANYWFEPQYVPELQQWIASAANLMRLVAVPDSYFTQECNRVVEDDQLKGGVPHHSILKLVGLLESVREELAAGLMRKAEYVFVATTFDDFLDHAGEYHKAGKKIESAVLAGAVFEDAIRRITRKNQIDEPGRNVELLIDDLVKKGVLTAIKAKRAKAFAGIRNKALHAQWDDFDIRDIGEMIAGTRELIEALL